MAERYGAKKPERTQRLFYLLVAIAAVGLGWWWWWRRRRQGLRPLRDPPWKTQSVGAAEGRKGKGGRAEETGVLAKVPPEDFSPDVWRLLKLITIQYPKVLPVGSFRYVAHKYPGDIDVLERFVECCSVNRTRFDFVRGIQGLVRQIESTENAFFADMKAGNDERFEFYIGQLVWNPHTQQQEVRDYKRGWLRKEIDNLRAQRLISASEHGRMLSLIAPCDDDPTPENFKALYDAIREYKLLRWTPDEILAGAKALPSHKTMFLADAVIQGSVVKLDVWTEVDGRYVEGSTFFYLQMIDEEGRRKTLSSEFPDYVPTLFEDIEAYIHKRKWLKAAKRSWSLAARVRDIPMLEALAPLFGSYAAFIYQVAGDVQVWLHMLEKLGSERMPWERLRVVAQNTLSRFREHSAAHRIDARIASPADSEFQALVAAIPEPESFIRHAQRIIEILEPMIERQTLAYLTRKRIDLSKWARGVLTADAASHHK